MAVKIRGKSDLSIDLLVTVLADYEREHVGAEIEIYRADKYSIRIRIVDWHFEHMSLGDRHDSLWQRFGHLPDDVIGDLSILLLLTPKEKTKSYASLDFDDPIASGF